MMYETALDGRFYSSMAQCTIVDHITFWKRKMIIHFLMEQR